MSQKPRPTARLFLLYIPAMTIVLVMVLAAAVLLNHHLDDPLDPETQAWLDYPPPKAEPGANGFLALVALNSQKPDPIAAAQGLLEAERQIARSEESDDASERYAAARQQWLQPYPKEVPQLVDCRIDCATQILAHRAELTTALTTYAPRLSRFSAMLDMQQYAELHLPRLGVPHADFRECLHLDTLYLARTVFMLDQGDASAAYADWSRRQKFWQRAAQGSHSLLNLIIALSALRNGEDVLTAMIVRHPETMDIARSQALPLLSESESETLRAAYARTQVYELGYARDTARWGDLAYVWHRYRHPAHGKESVRVRDLWVALSIKPNAMINTRRKALEDNLAAAGLHLDGKPLHRYPEVAAMCKDKAAVVFTAPDNASGNILACTGKMNLGTYLHRIDMLNGAAMEIRQALAAPYSPGVWDAVRLDLNKKEEEWNKS